MKNFPLVISTFFLIGFLMSCTNDKGPEPESKQIILSDTVFFSKDIKPIIETRCYMGNDGTNSCHGENGNSSQRFTTYEGFTKPYFIQRVSDAINHNQDNLVIPMPWPVGSAKIPADEIQKIESWIAQGKLNN